MKKYIQHENVRIGDSLLLNGRELEVKNIIDHAETLGFRNFTNGNPFVTINFVNYTQYQYLPAKN